MLENLFPSKNGNRYIVTMYTYDYSLISRIDEKPFDVITILRTIHDSISIWLYATSREDPKTSIFSAVYLNVKTATFQVSFSSPWGSTILP